MQSIGAPARSARPILACGHFLSFRWQTLGRFEKAALKIVELMNSGSADVIRLEACGKTLALSARKSSDDCRVTLLNRKRSRRRFSQRYSKMICHHDSLTHSRNGAIGSATKAQQNCFDNRSMIEAGRLDVLLCNTGRDQKRRHTRAITTK